ncbi:hypothetical protein COU39_00190 [Candidatus Micrarchaeota archaeon CG10_big_fil_rev_8_21_14_0_10_60_32]|nr:MAG: hypothetical protein AUJ16_00235 [Candidatus Micrarchaeota archaeon CG1_02_60_51]PIN96645.1 MAG: hypothetical protein COU39_00190 [Candidatus Micrarchaeota archaeon CG10_big_fil_rev_8_21_14_0_10_60_32]PIO02427.1 MAG: hypothetical protein COT58_00305 [Candidatus Micrarchaeota archaeon CG09_land_8_20_14_0_10_60_16]
MAVALLAPLALLALYYVQGAGIESRFLVSGVMGAELANYADSIRVDFPRALYVSGYGGTIACINHVIGSGAPADDAALRIEELAVNGTYMGEQSEIMGGNSSNNTLSGWADRLQFKGRSYGLQVNVSIVDYNVTQLDYANLRFQAVLFVNALSPAYGAGFSRYYYSEAVVPLAGMEDPLLPLNSYGLAQRTLSFNSTPLLGTTAFDAAVAAGTCWASSDGPSFLDRLEGSTSTSTRYAGQSANVIGFRTIVDLGYLIAQELPVTLNKTVVDSYYFNTTAPASRKVNGSAYWWAYLDDYTAGELGVTLQ